MPKTWIIHHNFKPSLCHNYVIVHCFTEQYLSSQTQKTSIFLWLTRVTLHILVLCSGNVGKELNQLISLMNSEDTDTADTAKNTTWTQDYTDGEAEETPTSRKTFTSFVTVSCKTLI